MCWPTFFEELGILPQDRFSISRRTQKYLHPILAASFPSFWISLLEISSFSGITLSFAYATQNKNITCITVDTIFTDMISNKLKKELFNTKQRYVYR